MKKTYNSSNRLAVLKTDRLSVSNLRSKVGSRSISLFDKIQQQNTAFQRNISFLAKFIGVLYKEAKLGLMLPYVSLTVIRTHGPSD